MPAERTTRAPRVARDSGPPEALGPPAGGDSPSRVVRDLPRSPGRSVLFRDGEGVSPFFASPGDGGAAPVFALVSCPWMLDHVPDGGETIWLTRLAGPGRQDPRAFEHEILPKVAAAVRAGPRSVVLDDVDYHLLVHGEKDGLRSLKRLVDLVVDKGSRCLAAAAPMPQARPQRAVLEGLFEEVRPAIPHAEEVSLEGARAVLTDQADVRRRVAGARGPVLAFSPAPARLGAGTSGSRTTVALGDGAGRLHPSEFPAEGLARIRRFVGDHPKGPRPLIVLDGLETLPLYLDASTVIEALKSAVDIVHAGGGILAASTERTAWGKDHWPLLQRRFERVAPALNG